MNIEEQENEILALGSILDEKLFKCDSNSGEIIINPVLKSSPLQLKFMNHLLKTEEIESNTKSTMMPVYHDVEFLPPLILNFTYPDNYPSDSPPKFTLSCKWLSKFQLITLCNELDKIWEREMGSVVLFQWYQFLENELFDALGIGVSMDIGPQSSKDNLVCTSNSSSTPKTIEKFQRAVPNSSTDFDILPYLVEYNQKKQEEIFNSSLFTCSICFDEKLGLQCVHSKACNHVHCRDCISSYFKIQIKEGNVAGLKCPEADCKSQPLPKMVQELIESDLYHRYETLLLQVTLDTMEDIIYCPLLHCQSPVILEKNSTLAQCPRCSFAFCPFCKLSYHGVSKCKLSSSELKKMCETYSKADEEERRQLEKKYGRKLLTTAVEEKQTELWMNSNAKPCPACNANIEKIEGCNKMTCYKCRAYFCWLCMKILSDVNPYQHYNDMKSPCHQKLFQGVDVDDDWWEFA